jgi:hypothetical protein
MKKCNDKIYIFIKTCLTLKKNSLIQKQNYYFPQRFKIPFI